MFREKSPFLCASIADSANQALPLGSTAHFKAHTISLWRPPLLTEQNKKNQSYSESQLINFVERAIDFVAALRWSTPNITLEISIFFSDAAKTLCAETKQSFDRVHISPCQMNSGETVFHDPTHRTIRIWRREDFHKVLIHELLHAYDWDRLLPPIPEVAPMESEALIECLACVFHCFLQAPDTWFWDAYEKERRHTKKQVQFLRAHPKHVVVRTTPQFYIDLKYALFCNIGALWSWLETGTKVKELQHTWNHLKTESKRLARQTLEDDDVSQEKCISLALVSRQLSLAPVAS